MAPIDFEGRSQDRKTAVIRRFLIADLAAIGGAIKDPIAAIENAGKSTRYRNPLQFNSDSPVQNNSDRTTGGACSLIAS